MADARAPHGRRRRDRLRVGGILSGVRVLDLHEAVWHEFAYGERFAARFADLSRPMGATKLGYNAQEIPPGKAQVPYHTHYVNEELLFVLDGTPRVRLDSGQHELRAHDVVALQPGASGVHQLLNYADAPARVLLASTMVPHELVEYPDSGKRLIALGGLARDPVTERVMLRGDQATVLPGTRGGGMETYFADEPFDQPLGDPPPVAAERDPRIANLDEIPWEPYRIGPFGAERKRVARHLGAKLLGYSHYRVQPGERTFPYHFEHTNEEFALVLSGRARLRTPDGEREVGPNDAMCFPVGPSGAHGLTAIGPEPLEVFFLSTMIEPDVAEYPDSEKIYVLVGAAPGGDAGARLVDLVFRKADAVPYETDEV